MHIHPVFHVSLLEPHVPNTFPGRVVEVPLPIQVDGLPEFEVNSILDSRFRRRKLQYLVDWVGYDESERSWEPADNITNQWKMSPTHGMRLLIFIFVFPLVHVLPIPL